MSYREGLSRPKEPPILDAEFTIVDDGRPVSPPEPRRTNPLGTAIWAIFLVRYPVLIYLAGRAAYYRDLNEAMLFAGVLIAQPFLDWLVKWLHSAPPQDR